MPGCRSIVWILCFLPGWVIGCSQSTPDRPEGAYAASDGSADEVIPPVAEDPMPVPTDRQPSRSEPVQPLAAELDGQGMMPRVSEPVRQDVGNQFDPGKIPVVGEGDGDRFVSRELPPDLSPQELVKFLAGADQDMQTIVTGRSGIQDPQEARDALVRIIKMKLEASGRLARSDDASDAMRSEGKRGQLQAMSHLASLGDLKVAEQLKQLAEQNLASGDDKLVADSRLVLIGFAIEGLQNGEANAPSEITDLVNQISHSKTASDVATMMVMGQARQVLASYGHDAEAKQVRDTIIDLFADSPEPQIAQMAARLAGNVRFDAIEKMRAKIIDGNTIEPAQWQEAVELLIDESADLQTVQYLAGAALEFESVKQLDVMQSTYDVMKRRFSDMESATGKEVALAIEAKLSRERVMGRQFDPDLPAVDGSRIDLRDVRGKVVLMPFWAMSFPESLQLLPMLNKIRDANSDRVVIVGMNLDPHGAAVEEFLATNDLGFQSFRAESSATTSVANPVAAQFGLVSMPFVAVLDQDGRVAEINFTGRGLEKFVQTLVDEENDDL